jgi:hypothetical protein
LTDAAIVLKQHKVAQVVQQVLRCQHAAHQGLQLVELAQRVDRDTPSMVRHAIKRSALALRLPNSASVPSEITSTSLVWNTSGICSL